MTYDLPSSSTDTTRIAIVGAGSSGLAQLEQLLEVWARDEVKTKLEVVVYEAREDVGGVWLADEEQPKPHRLAKVSNSSGPMQVFSYPPATQNPSPMYEGLRTNLPNDLMSFRGFKFPEGTATFPDRDAIEKYLQAFAAHYNLLPYIRFNTRVQRLYLTPNPSAKSRKWTVESSTAPYTEEKVEEFDHVSVTNGHYSDGWIPDVEGLASFPGQIIHSRFYRSAIDFVGQRILVVGSYASGGDISRLIAGLNIDKYHPSGEPINGHPVDKFTEVYVSSSGPNPFAASLDGPWAPFITYRPLIDRIDEEGRIHFHPSKGEGEEKRDDTPLEGIDTIIFATGYNFYLPFCKDTDAPWNGKKLMTERVKDGERDGGDEWEIGGLKGLGMKGLDELLLFLEGDRSVAFPQLIYQCVPFPLAQVQARLTSLLWAGLLPSFPAHPTPPPNPTNPFSIPSAPATASQPFDNADPTANSKPHRKVVLHRQELVFGAPYEWTYSEYLMDLMREADERAGRETEDHWKRVEPWRRERREQTDLRKKTLGY
ncbi:hypothetical protein CI109_101307 [Kwoniella shandongensis]|uniref:FAD-dependent urate hydroxylase HpyO/Asp monooxygenase CreE-like FAD/NAD(P)-binding domain-containing protein n=1 Tax=Kwoniella shandongensis TaxID=1734106 RepID=A0A5M6BU29_9TREE|nr:uncharacterized protein CI109_005315 [Kwoniella shandongensis]KAA5526358.1 hypothetical protein CI109_005315 [Kwoniella shandongensis]